MRKPIRGNQNSEYCRLILSITLHFFVDDGISCSKCIFCVKLKKKTIYKGINQIHLKAPSPFVSYSLSVFISRAYFNLSITKCIVPGKNN